MRRDALPGARRPVIKGTLVRPRAWARTDPRTPKHWADYGGCGESIKRSGSVCCRASATGAHLRRHASPGARLPRTGLARRRASPARAARGSGGGVCLEEGRGRPGPIAANSVGKPRSVSGPLGAALAPRTGSHKGRSVNHRVRRPR